MRPQATAPSLKTRERFSRIVPALLMWYKKNKRSFIWRDLERSPYIVLVSEFMLQQTQAQTIEKRLPLFLKRFPTMNSLANAPRGEVLHAWQGLGYNRRALNLHKTAKELALLGEANFPQTLEALRALPGIGHYTASAILVFSFGKDLPVVDVNIERVLSRLWKPMKQAASVLPFVPIVELDRAILPKRRSSDWHQALMDLGSTICTKRAPRCSACPLMADCPSAKYLSKATTSRSPVATSKELRYFGAPKRIWRGRTLKIVIEKQKVTEAQVVKSLATKHGLLGGDLAAFRLFIRELLGVLAVEGFARRHRSTYFVQE